MLIKRKGGASNSEWVGLVVRESFLEIVTSQLSFEALVGVPQVKEEEQNYRKRGQPMQRPEDLRVWYT